LLGYVKGPDVKIGYEGNETFNVTPFT